jgi:hypothetical protein
MDEKLESCKEKVQDLYLSLEKANKIVRDLRKSKEFTQIELEK